ncbi:hypothetical protein ACHAPT_012630 [Fusarium lateritium]
MHGTLFKLLQNGLVPFEFAAGPSPVAARAGPANNVPAEFPAAFAAYLCEHGLVDRLSLEIKDFGKPNTNNSPGGRAEFEIQWGSNRAAPGAESFTIPGTHSEKIIVTGGGGSQSNALAPATAPLVLKELAALGFIAATT